jgi:hypothetical protein
MFRAKEFRREFAEKITLNSDQAFIYSVAIHIEHLNKENMQLAKILNEFISCHLYVYVSKNLPGRLKSFGLMQRT